MIDKIAIKISYEEILENLKNKAKLIAVSKYQSIDKIKYLVELGQTDFGENYLQELELKATQIANINWHFIGSLQSNKIKHIVKYASTIQSVAKLEHLEKINHWALKLGKTVKIFLQINIDDDPNKSGFKPNELDKVLECINLSAKCNNIKIVGLMCLPSQSKKPENSFQKMENFFKKINLNISNDLQLVELSMGMSADYKIALNHNATMVRVGSSLFGERTYTK